MMTRRGWVLLMTKRGRGAGAMMRVAGGWPVRLSKAGRLATI